MQSRPKGEDLHAQQAGIAVNRADRAAAARFIAIHPQAPPKPAWGEPCNGCGVCCLSEPCPVGMLLSRRRRGACVALVWVDAAGCYRCGLLVAPAEHLPALLRPAAPLLQKVARRFIAAGVGCDCDIELELAAANAPVSPPPESG